MTICAPYWCTIRALISNHESVLQTMETAPITQQLDDLQQRVEALRGYL